MAAMKRGHSTEARRDATIDQPATTGGATEDHDAE